MINVPPVDDALHLRAEETVQRDKVVLVHKRIVLLVRKIGDNRCVSCITMVSAIRRPKIAP